VAKLSGAGPGDITRPQVLRLRQRVSVKERNGTVVIAAWPKRRGPHLSRLQQAWVNRFKCLARAFKSPDPISLEVAEAWAHSIRVESAAPIGGSGWYYRDVMARAAYGKLISYQGEKRIVTPTVKATRTTDFSLGAGGDSPCPLTAIEWDNNQFWSATTNPTRLTVRAPGLYMIGAVVTRQTGNTARQYAYIRQNGTVTVAVEPFEAFSSPMWTTLEALVYAHADEWFDLRIFNTSGTSTFRVVSFWMVAITPEGIIP